MEPISIRTAVQALAPRHRIYAPTDYFGLGGEGQLRLRRGSALPAGFYYQPESHMNVLGLRLEYQLR